MQKEILLTDLKLHDINPVSCGWEDCRPGHAFGPAVRFLLAFALCDPGQGSLYRRREGKPGAGWADVRHSAL